VASVDHIEIFPSSTSGWVRVKGHENFKRAFSTFRRHFLALLAGQLSPLSPRRAWAERKEANQPRTRARSLSGHLDGGVFQGRALIAKGDNATKEIMIRDLHLPPEPAPAGGSSSIPATPPFSPTATSEYTQQSDYPRSEYTQSDYTRSEYTQSEYPQTEYSTSDYRQSEYGRPTGGTDPARQRVRPACPLCLPPPHYPGSRLLSLPRNLILLTKPMLYSHEAATAPAPPRASMPTRTRTIRTVYQLVTTSRSARPMPPPPPAAPQPPP